VQAFSILDVHEAVGGVDGFDEATKRLRAFGRFANSPCDDLVSERTRGSGSLPSAAAASVMIPMIITKRSAVRIAGEEGPRWLESVVMAFTSPDRLGSVLTPGGGNAV
jgi:hypothetical protein